MYEYFHGNLAEKTPQAAIVDVRGVGYKLWIPIHLFGKLPHIGERVLLYASWVVREMSQTLYGFETKEERDLFELLLTLSGIGPKTALGIVGYFSVADLEEAVRMENSKTLSKVPGIGKKTAERLIVDLKGRLKVTASCKSPSFSRIEDALNALLNLGYTQTQAEFAVKKAAEELTDESDLSLLITAALKYQRN